MMASASEIIRCLLSDLDTDTGRQRYAASIARHASDPVMVSEYAKAAAYFEKRIKARGAA